MRRSPRVESRSAGRSAFTLVELLVSASILTLMTLFLVAMTNQASRLWSQEQAREQHRQRARAALDFIGRELRAAALPVVPDPARPSLQFIINPPGIGPDAANRDSIFWQAPIATDSTRGDLAEVGYFVRWNGTQANLCRFFVNPSDTTNYLIYSSPAAWLSANTLTTVAPADKANLYRGLFLENVIGLWVQGHIVVKNATSSVETDTDFSSSGQDARFNNDSRPNAARTFDQLPAYVEISLALLDPFTAARMQTEDATTVRNLAATTAAARHPPKTADLAAAFVQALPARLRPGASVVNLKVNLANYHANYEQ